MDLVLAPSSEPEVAIVRQTIERLHRSNHSAALALNLVQQTIASPHAVFDLRADEVAAGKGLAAAHPAGTRYLVGGVGGPTAAAEVAGGGATSAVVNFGPFVSGTADALRLLQAEEAPGGGPFEVRLLRFSALGLMVLWLHTAAGQGDRVFPIEPIPGGLLRQTLYTEADFLAAIQPAAAQRLAAGAPGAAP